MNSAAFCLELDVAMELIDCIIRIVVGEELEDEFVVVNQSDLSGVVLAGTITGASAQGDGGEE